MTNKFGIRAGQAVYLGDTGNGGAVKASTSLNTVVGPDDDIMLVESGSFRLERVSAGALMLTVGDETFLIATKRAQRRVRVTRVEKRR